MEENNKFDMILESLQEIAAKLESIKERPKSSVTHRSDDLKDLFTALAKAQGEFKTAGLNSQNPYFKSKYADLTEIVKASRPALSKNELSVMQDILINEEGQNILHTILAHSSGQWIESRMRIVPPKPDVQSLGSYITYLRRYAYSSLIGVVVADEDDDGEIAVHEQRKVTSKGVALNRKYNPKEESYETISKEQLEEAEYELSEYPDIAEQVLDGLKIQSLADMPKSKFLISMRRIREIKNLRNGKQS